MNLLTTAAAGVLIAAAAGMAGFGKGYSAGSAAVQQAWDKEKAAQEAAYAKAQEEARYKEQQLQASADLLRQEKDREIRDLNARAAALSHSLRNRAARPETSGSAETAEARPAASGCTGAGLYRPDGEFLAGEAVAGRTCQAYLRECRDHYEAAVKLLNKE